MFDPDRADRLASVALSHRGPDEIEFHLEQSETQLNRFTHDHPVQNQLLDRACVRVRVRVDGREGSATTGTITEDGVRGAVDRAVAVARRMPLPKEAPAALPGPHEYELRGLDPLPVDADRTADAVRSLIEPCREQGVGAAGIHSGTNTFTLIANSRGLRVSDIDTRATVSLSTYQQDGAGWAGRSAATADALDEESIARRAVEKAVRSRSPRDFAPGHYTVVLEPAAVSSLLLFAGYKAFGAQQVDEGSSFLSGHMGEPVLGSNVSIFDDAHHPLTVGHTFDHVGVPRRRVELIREGIATGMVHDQRTASRHGCASTGHSEPQPSASGPLPHNLVLAGVGGATADLIRDVNRGLLVTSFHYTNMIEPMALTLTGMTRNGTFLIERGEVGPPVRNLRFTQSLVEALKRVTGFGDDPSLMSALFRGHMVVPSLRIDGFNFSSRTGF